MNKNLINALRLAGLLNEQEQPPLAPPQGGEEPEGGGGGDPGALLDQAIELLNQVKAAIGGGGDMGVGGEPNMGEEPAQPLGM